ncbi:unnamed protein product [Angiostrongylus costaricensis]|uniref:Uncharacterized protein n=1 Tax=Angiostrongylus costaricensis TaxID=334426 RepID=A0A0R3PGF1_ANGCS|nr:unnamed protein product [Angiostrongylus costaricensis]
MLCLEIFTVVSTFNGARKRNFFKHNSRRALTSIHFVRNRSFGNRSVVLLEPLRSRGLNVNDVEIFIERSSSAIPENADVRFLAGRNVIVRGRPSSRRLDCLPSQRNHASSIIFFI